MENLLMRLLAVVNSRLVDETERVIATNLLKNIRKEGMIINVKRTATL